MTTHSDGLSRIRSPMDVSQWGTEGGCYSHDGLYRWSFERRWSRGPLACWIGLNPGTGDSDKHPRRSLHRMVEWSLGLGCGGIIVVNLFAYRATDFRVLREMAAKGCDVIGRENDAATRKAADRAKYTILAWGSGGSLLGRGQIVAARFPKAWCLGWTATGQPFHPLYVPGTAKLLPDRVPLI